MISYIKKINKLNFFLIFFSASLFSQNKTAKDYINKGIEQLFLDKNTLAIQDFEKAQKIVDKNYNFEDQFMIYNNIGLLYYKIENLEKALKYYQLAYNLANKENKNNYEMTVLNNFAVVYLKLENYKRAENYLLEAFDLAKLYKNYEKLAIYAINLASVNFEMQEFSKAHIYLKEIDLIDKKFITPYINLNYQILLSNLQLVHQNPDKIIDRLKSLLTTYSGDKYQQEQFDINFTIAKAYRKKGNLNIAISILESLKSKGNSHDNKYKVYKLLSEIYYEKNDIKSAFSTKDSMMKYNELKIAEKNKNSLENLRLNFDLKRSIDQNVNQKNKFRIERFLYLAIIVLAITSIILLILNRKRNKKNQENKRLIFEQNLKIKEYELQELMKKTEILSNEIIEQKKALEINHNSNHHQLLIKDRFLEESFLYQKTKNELLREMIDELLNMKSKFDQNHLLDVVQKLRNHLQVDVMDTINAPTKTEIKSNILEIIREHYPHLKLIDLRLLTLIFLKVENKEMAQLLCISPDNVRKRKERLKSKIGLENDTDLYTHLQDLDICHKSSQ